MVPRSEMTNHILVGVGKQLGMKISGWEFVYSFFCCCYYSFCFKNVRTSLFPACDEPNRVGSEPHAAYMNSEGAQINHLLLRLFPIPVLPRSCTHALKIRSLNNNVLLFTEYLIFTLLICEGAGTWTFHLLSIDVFEMVSPVVNISLISISGTGIIYWC